MIIAGEDLRLVLRAHQRVSGSQNYCRCGWCSSREPMPQAAATEAWIDHVFEQLEKQSEALSV